MSKGGRGSRSSDPHGRGGGQLKVKGVVHIPGGGGGQKSGKPPGGKGRKKKKEKG